MDERTLEALKGSIAAWEQKLANPDPSVISVGITACPLCTIFFDEKDNRSYHCSGCPVRETVGATLCYRTPYTAARQALIRWRDEPDSTLRAHDWYKACKTEIEFLKSLLPENNDASSSV